MEAGTKFELKLLSALDKVFGDENPCAQPDCQKLTALRGETVSFQLAYRFDFRQSRFAHVKILSPIKNWVRVRSVVSVPCQLPVNAVIDDNYLRTKPGLYPDLLVDLQDEGRVLFTAGQWSSLWIDVEVDSEIPAGTHSIDFQFFDYADDELLCEASQKVTIYDVTLPKQTLLRTEWFHGDCLAEIYDVEVFSERHWDILENFLATAAKRGCNMILTPQFTPPLDTAKGFERTTIQLVDIEVKQGEYHFGFDKLKRWVDICCQVGFTHFEMSHLFTQWGAIAAPKVMGVVDGDYQRIFGWESPAVGGEYTEFLYQYLPALIQKLNEWGIAERTWFHISDEPNLEQLESYRAAKDSVAKLLSDFVIMDALSDYEFYQTGALSKPVCGTHKIHTFLEQGVENMWAYYCNVQSLEVSNRFFSMPSARTRIYGLQLYKYKIEGALHWGYNFYNAQDSIGRIDPYRETCADATYPGGDSFLVYPKADGTAEESIRLMLMDEAMADMRALQLLEKQIGREKVVAYMEEFLAEPITFSCYPKSASWLIQFRNKINALLAE